MRVIEILSKRHIRLPLTLMCIYMSFATSIVYEYYLKIEPSTLCLAQRYASVAGIIFVTIALLSTGKLHKNCIYFSSLSMFVGAVFACYHLLIQYTVFEEPNIFKLNFPANMTAVQFSSIIRYNEVTSCASVEPTISGIPTTVFVFVLFVFLFIYLSCYFKNNETTNSE